MSPKNHGHEPTFKSYSAAQAKAYAKGRRGYSAQLYETIFAYHADSGGSFTRALDVGCGTGNATREVATAFDETFGIDDSMEMINVARNLGGVSRSGRPIVFTVASAEDVGLFEEESVDLATVAMAAHWFDMNTFWPSLAKVLRPNGTAALWNICSMFCHPSTPNAKAIQAVMNKFEHETLKPYSLPGNFIALEGYKDLPLPWNISPPESAFDKSSFVRKEWNKGGQVNGDEEFFSGNREQSLDELEQSISTASAVTRWRAANPKLANTPNDCVKQLIAGIKSLLPPGTQTLVVGGSTALLMLKKTSAP